MSDLMREPDDNEQTYAETRERQADLEGLVEEEDGDFQDAVDAQQEGERPDPEDETNYKIT